MEKDWYDKYGKEFHCADCTFLDSCLKKDAPLYSRCCEQYLRDRIAELEEQLKDCIKPKYKIGQTVWYIYDNKIKSFIISKIEIEIRTCPLIAYSSPYIYQYEENCFYTKEDALNKLEELQKLK